LSLLGVYREEGVYVGVLPTLLLPALALETLLGTGEDRSREVAAGEEVLFGFRGESSLLGSDGDCCGLGTIPSTCTVETSLILSLFRLR
jgi:hypothetical protein